MPCLPWLLTAHRIISQNPCCGRNLHSFSIPCLCPPGLCSQHALASLPLQQPPTHLWGLGFKSRLQRRPWDLPKHGHPYLSPLFSLPRLCPPNRSITMCNYFVCLLVFCLSARWALSPKRAWTHLLCSFRPDAQYMKAIVITILLFMLVLAINLYFIISYDDVSGWFQTLWVECSSSYLRVSLSFSYLL